MQNGRVLRLGKLFLLLSLLLPLFVDVAPLLFRSSPAYALLSLTFIFFFLRQQLQVHFLSLCLYFFISLSLGILLVSFICFQFLHFFYIPFSFHAQSFCFPFSFFFILLTLLLSHRIEESCTECFSLVYFIFSLSSFRNYEVKLSLRERFITSSILSISSFNASGRLILPMSHPRHVITGCSNSICCKLQNKQISTRFSPSACLFHLLISVPFPRLFLHSPLFFLFNLTSIFSTKYFTARDLYPILFFLSRLSFTYR